MDPIPEQIRQAAKRLPKRQREALELRELQRHSYEEIGEILGTSRGLVAQLISRARINLYDELRGTLLASVAAPSPECERAVPLIAAREDGQLDPASADDDAAWLATHLADCDRCCPAVEQMAEAATSYRAWAQSGSPATAPSERADAPTESAEALRRRRPMLVAASVGALLLLGIAAFAASGGDGPPSADPPAEARATVEPSDTQPTRRGTTGLGGKRKPSPNGNEKRKAKAVNGDPNASAGQPEATAAPVAAVVTGAAQQNDGATSEPASVPSRPSGKAGVDAPRQASTPQTVSKPKRAPASVPEASPPATTTEAPPAEAPPPAEEAPKAPGRSGEAPGKPADRPPR